MIVAATLKLYVHFHSVCLSKCRFSAVKLLECGCLRVIQKIIWQLAGRHKCCLSLYQPFSVLSGPETQGFLTYY